MNDFTSNDSNFNSNPRTYLFAFSYFSKVRINKSQQRHAVWPGNSIEFKLNKKFDSVDLKTSQGVVKLERNNAVRIIPATSGKDTLFFKFFNKGMLIFEDTSIFDIIDPEVFPAYGGNLLKRKLGMEFLQAMGGFVFYMRVNDYHWEPIGIKSYRFSIIRKGVSIYSTVEYSNQYSEEVKEKLKTLESGDIILITDTDIINPQSKSVNILPGVFEIN